MSASRKPGLAGRDPFAAFACDDTTRDALADAALALGFAPEKCVRGGLRNAVQALSVAASPAILVVDLSDCSDPLNEINALAEVCEPGTIVLALGRVNDVRLFRQLMASGIHDYLLKPLSAAQLGEALAQAKESAVAPRAADAETTRSHISTAVIGTRGGVGASSIATSLGWLFSTAHRMPTALLDLDVHWGSAALSLDLEPGRGLIDAIADPGRIDGLFIERAMIRSNDNLAILSAEAPITAPLSTDGAAFMQLEEEFRQAFDATVIDLPRNMLINFPQLVAQVNNVVLVTEMTLASARDTIRLLSWLKSHAPAAQPMIVANKVQPGLGEIAKGDFETSVEYKISHVIPFDQKVAVNAAKLGQSIAEAAGSAKAGAVLRSIATTLIGTADDDEAASGAASLLGRLDLKALLAKKPAAPPAKRAQAA